MDWFRSKALLDEDVAKVRACYSTTPGKCYRGGSSSSQAAEELPLLNPVGEYTVLDSTAADLADANKRSERAVREKELGNNVRPP